ncbi:hypothetical protein L902_28470 [Agrobacterium radiobacter DSM 30147]|nr:hypothetical protein L902_28470 [Agrobacterium radiobacter DSM 30147]
MRVAAPASVHVEWPKALLPDRVLGYFREMI